MRTTGLRLLNKFREILFFSMVLIISGCSNESNELASYDGGSISPSEFLSRYEHFLTVTGLEDNILDRKKILRSAIHEELILNDWSHRNLDNDPPVQAALQRQMEQAILDAWWFEKSVSDKEPSAEALAQMLIREKSYYHIQESYHFDLDAAKQAEAQWQTRTIEGVQDLGFLSLEDVHPRFAGLIYKMKVGDVSSPVRMGEGYRLIKLLEKRIPPLIRPRDFAVSKKRLTQEWHVTQSDSIIDAYTGTLLNNLDVQFDDEGCYKLFELIQMSPDKQLLQSLPESDLAAETVCQSKNGEWTIAMLAPHLQDTKNSHLAAIIDVEDVKSIVSGILVRRELLNEAISAGIDKSSSTLDAIQKRQDLWRIKKWQQHFADTVSIDEQYLAEVAELESPEGQSVPHREVVAMVFSDTRTALDSYNELNSGASPTAVSSHAEFFPNIQKDGNMGWVSAANLGQAAKLVFEQPLNSWTQPWTYKGKSFLFKSIAEKDVKVDILEQQREIEKQVRYAGAPVQLEKTLSAMEKNYHVKIYNERIKEIPYIQLSGTIDES